MPATFLKKADGTSYYTGEVDGLWGTQTEEATRQLQRRLDITADGVFGDGTMNAAFAALASGKPLPKEK